MSQLAAPDAKCTHRVRMQKLHLRHSPPQASLLCQAHTNGAILDEVMDTSAPHGMQAVASYIVTSKPPHAAISATGLRCKANSISSHSPRLCQHDHHDVWCTAPNTQPLVRRHATHLLPSKPASVKLQLPDSLAPCTGLLLSFAAACVAWALPPRH